MYVTQVFHSLNEYKAHRQNRTEQLRLRDVEHSLHKEQKLYSKEYALHRSQIHSRIARRFSDSAVRYVQCAPIRYLVRRSPDIVTYWADP